MSYAGDIHAAEVKKRIANDLAEHVVTERHCIGIYRHWRCQKPGTWVLGFDIVTWPGSICITGDMGEYLFQRTNDMVAFMRRSCMDYSYAAEKCVAHDGRLTEWSEDQFKKRLADEIKKRPTFDVIRYGNRRETLKTTEVVKEILQAYDVYSDRYAAERAMYESGLFDGCDMPNLEEYTYHFLWALHAIQWFIAKLDAKEVMRVEATVSA